MPREPPVMITVLSCMLMVHPRLLWSAYSVRLLLLIGHELIVSPPPTQSVCPVT